MTPDYTLIHIAVVLAFLLVVVAVAALIDWIFGTWKKPVLPPHKHVVNWCDKNGHHYLDWDGHWVCVHCGDTAFPVEETTELGHQGQPGRAA